MSYQLYRNTTLGHTLQESLDEQIQLGQISPNLALKVLLQFDKAINQALAQRVKTKISFKGKLNTYRFCDNVWTFVLNKVDFREAPVQELVKVDKVKIVACDGKSMWKVCEAEMDLRDLKVLRFMMHWGSIFKRFEKNVWRGGIWYGSSLYLNLLKYS